MTVLLPASLDQACAQLADHPDAHVLAGGTDLMVEVNAGHRRPTAVLSLAGVGELKGWRREGDALVLGAGTTYTELTGPDLARLAPALAQAARTVGSPQIRNAGTIGGNLATASPAGDALPVLVALDATVELASTRGTRAVSVTDYLVGPKRTDAERDELVVAVRIPLSDSRQEFLKVGTRNAMVIAVASVAAVVDLDARHVRLAMGSVGPTVLRAHDAEAFASDAIDWDRGAQLDPAALPTLGALVADAARPIDDHRSTASYRRRCVGVLATRALRRLCVAPPAAGAGLAA